MTDFKTYLNKFSKNSDSFQTHLSLTGGKYNVPDEEYDEFYKTYFDQLKKETKMHLVEKVKDSKFALFFDLDTNANISALKETDIKAIIKIILKVLHCKIQPESNIDKYGYVLSRRDYKYHINFYNIIVDCTIAQNIIKLIEQEIDDKCNQYNGIIDKSVYRTGLRLLGSFKKTEEICYKVYDLETEKYIDNLDWDTFSKCIVRRKADIKLTDVCKSLGTTTKEVQKTKVENIKNKILENEIYKLVKTLNTTKINGELLLKDYNFDILRIYASLNTTGVFCYYLNIADKHCPFKCREHKRSSSPIYLELSTKGIFIKCYDTECLKKRYPEEGIPLPSNMENEYKELHCSMTIKYWNVDLNMTPEIRQSLEESLSGTHYKVAKAMFSIYKDQFRVDEIKNSEWYRFNCNRWEKTLMLNILISEGLPRYYKGMKTINNPKDTSINDFKDYLVNEDELEDNVRNQQIDNIISKLENVTFKDNIMNQLTYLFKTHDVDFYKNLDANPYLLGFNNGVYDFKKCIFRKGELTDYITYSTGYDYIPYNNDDQHVKDIYEFLSKIITNKNVREYLLKVLGKSLMGIPDEKFYIFTGLSGANGKSTLINFLELALGDYTVSVDTSLLTNKRGNASSVSPDVIRLKGRRIIAFQEPEHNDKLRTGILKQFSGNDSIIARDLYKSPISFKIQGTMIMCCNDLPTVTSTDGGTWRRIRVIDFNSRFCENPKKPNEFLIDPKIKEKINLWKPYFMSILIHYYNLFKKEGMTEPDEVKTATNKYKTDNDKFNEFFDVCLIENDKNIETFKDIYSNLTCWWSENYSNVKMPDTRELKRALKTKYGMEKEKIMDGMTRYGFNVEFNQKYNKNTVINDDDSSFENDY
jgi:P4 family phage/plasmid primase-like protien